MTTDSLNINLSHDPADLAVLRPEWDDLVAARETNLFCLTWEWATTWWGAYGDGRQLWLITARTPSGELVGLVPLVDKRRKVGPIRWRELVLLGADDVEPDHVDLLTKPGWEEAVVQGAIDTLRVHGRQWDTIRLASLRADSVHLPILERSGFPVRATEGPLCPYITLPGDWETYSQSLGKDLRKKLRRYTNRLERAYPGQIAYRRVADPADLDRTLAVLMDFHQERFEARGGVGAFGTPERRAFHQAITRLGLERGWMRLLVLNVAGRDVAAIYTMQHQDKVCDYQSGFDPAFAEFSLGHLMTAYSIQRGIEEEGVVEYDLLRGAEGYKLRYTEEEPRRDVDLELIGSARAGIKLAIVDAMTSVWSVVKHVLPKPLRRRLAHSAKET